MRATTTVVPSNVRRFAAGEHCTDSLPGDILLVRHHGLLPSAIRFGQRLRFRGAKRQFAWCNHAAVILTGGPDATLVEQASRGGQVVNLADYVAEEYAVITLARDVDRMRVAEYAETTVGDRYGFPTIVASVLFCLTGLRVDFGFGDWMICSVATAEAMKCGGIIVRPNFGQLPADLAEMLGVSA